MGGDNMNMFKFKVKIIFAHSDGIGLYDVGDVYEHKTDDGNYLAMRRLKDGEYGYIPMELIKSYEILERA